MKEKLDIKPELKKGEFESILIRDIVRREAVELRAGQISDYEPMIEAVGEARFVLIGEASHGTHEFYRERAQITKRLIQEKGFSAIAVEAGFPRAYRVNRYARGMSKDEDAIEALGVFGKEYREERALRSLWFIVYPLS